MAIGSDGDGGGWLFAAPSNRELNEVLPTRRPSVEWRQVRCATKPVRSNQVRIRPLSMWGGQPPTSGQARLFMADYN